MNENPDSYEESGNFYFFKYAEELLIFSSEILESGNSGCGHIIGKEPLLEKIR